MDANERQPSNLGSVSEVAAAAAREYRRRRFSGRHPWLAFVVAPTIALPLLWAASLLLMVFTFKTVGFDSADPTVSAGMSSWVNKFLPLTIVLILVLPVITATVAFCRLGIRSAVDRRWLLLCCAILALLGGAVNSTVSLPSAGMPGSISFGLGFSLPPTPQQLAQFILPLLVGFFVIRLSGRHLFARGEDCGDQPSPA